MKVSLAWFSLLLLALAACKKEVEKIVVQDKMYSWTPVSRLYGYQQIVLNMGKDAESLYLQNPNLMSIVSPLPTSAAYRANGYVAGPRTSFPPDVNLLLPMGRTFIAQPALDTLVYLLRPSEPTSGNSAARIRLRQLDPLATGIVPNFLPTHAAFGAIDQNNYLLFSYYSTNRAALQFVLSHVVLSTASGLPKLEQQARTVAIPRTILSANSAVRCIQAIDDYFLVSCEDEGLFKISENGTVKRVFGPNYLDTAYKWQGVVYAVENLNTLLKSTDNGETWQRYTGTPDAFNASTYRVVGDSLVGIKRGLVNLLFTLRWNGQSYRLRELKNDGLGQGDLRGLEQLGDTVYAGTTSGLFKRPLNQFFESKP